MMMFLLVFSMIVVADDAPVVSEEVIVEEDCGFFCTVGEFLFGSSEARALAGTAWFDRNDGLPLATGMGVGCDVMSVDNTIATGTCYYDEQEFHWNPDNKILTHVISGETIKVQNYFPHDEMQSFISTLPGAISSEDSQSVSSEPSTPEPQAAESEPAPAAEPEIDTTLPSGVTYTAKGDGVKGLSYTTGGIWSKSTQTIFVGDVVKNKNSDTTYKIMAINGNAVEVQYCADNGQCTIETLKSAEVFLAFSEENTLYIPSTEVEHSANLDKGTPLAPPAANPVPLMVNPLAGYKMKELQTLADQEIEAGNNQNVAGIYYEMYLRESKDSPGGGQQYGLKAVEYYEKAEMFDAALQIHQKQNTLPSGCIQGSTCTYGGQVLVITDAGIILDENTQAFQKTILNGLDSLKKGTDFLADGVAGNAQKVVDFIGKSVDETKKTVGEYTAAGVTGTDEMLEWIALEVSPEDVKKLKDRGIDTPKELSDLCTTETCPTISNIPGITGLTRKADGTFTEIQFSEIATPVKLPSGTPKPSTPKAQPYTITNGNIVVGTTTYTKQTTTWAGDGKTLPVYKSKDNQNFVAIDGELVQVDPNQPGVYCESKDGSCSETTKDINKARRSSVVNQNGVSLTMNGVVVIAPVAPTAAGAPAAAAKKQASDLSGALGWGAVFGLDTTSATQQEADREQVKMFQRMSAAAVMAEKLKAEIAESDVAIKDLEFQEEQLDYEIGAKEAFIASLESLEFSQNSDDLDIQIAILEESRSGILTTMGQLESNNKGDTPEFKTQDSNAKLFNDQIEKLKALKTQWSEDENTNKQSLKNRIEEEQRVLESLMDQDERLLSQLVDVSAASQDLEDGAKLSILGDADISKLDEAQLELMVKSAGYKDKAAFLAAKEVKEADLDALKKLVQNERTALKDAKLPENAVVPPARLACNNPEKTCTIRKEMVPNADRTNTVEKDVMYFVNEEGEIQQSIAEDDGSFEKVSGVLEGIKLPPGIGILGSPFKDTQISNGKTTGIALTNGMSIVQTLATPEVGTPAKDETLKTKGTTGGGVYTANVPTSVLATYTKGGIAPRVTKDGVELHTTAGIMGNIVSGDQNAKGVVASKFTPTALAGEGATPESYWNVGSQEVAKQTAAQALEGKVTIGGQSVFVNDGFDSQVKNGDFKYYGDKEKKKALGDVKITDVVREEVTLIDPVTKEETKKLVLTDVTTISTNFKTEVRSTTFEKEKETIQVNDGDCYTKECKTYHPNSGVLLDSETGMPKSLLDFDYTTTEKGDSFGEDRGTMSMEAFHPSSGTYTGESYGCDDTGKCETQFIIERTGIFASDDGTYSAKVGDNKYKLKKEGGDWVCGEENGCSGLEIDEDFQKKADSSYQSKHAQRAQKTAESVYAALGSVRSYSALSKLVGYTGWDPKTWLGDWAADADELFASMTGMELYTSPICENSWDIEPEGKRMMKTASGTYQPVASIQAERTSKMEPILCERNPDTESEEEWVCGKDEVCYENVCYDDIDADGDPDNPNDPKMGYFYKVTWAVSAPIDEAFTPYRDENGIAVSFNIWLDDQHLYIRRGDKDGPIELKNGDSDKQVITKYSSLDYSKAWIIWDNAPQTIPIGGVGLKKDISDVDFDIVISTQGQINWKKSGQPTASTKSTDAEVDFVTEWK